METFQQFKSRQPIRYSNVYLGDGVTVSFDGDLVVLRTKDGLSVTNEIFLNLEVLDALNKYIERITGGDK